MRSSGKSKRRGVENIGRAIARLAVLWLVIALAGGIFNDAGVHASEGGTLQLEGPQVRTELPQARVIVGSEDGQLQIVREVGEKTRSVSANGAVNP